jgi:hypothetical protein
MCALRLRDRVTPAEPAGELGRLREELANRRRVVCVRDRGRDHRQAKDDSFHLFE